MKILVIGTGYVGLVTGTCFAEMGHHVTCLDKDKNRVTQLQSGHVELFEPGLAELVARNIKANRLSFTHSYKQGMEEALFCFISVGTPMKSDGSAYLDDLYSVAENIATHMKEYTVIVNKSTVPVGTAKVVKKLVGEILESLDKDIEYDVVSNPEFLKEGDAINDFMKPDRVILGVDNVRVASLLKELYSPFTLSHDRILVMDPASSEITKYAANVMLATRISLMNELAGLCECVGADINQIRKGIGSDRRIGYDFLYAGPGYGGSCFPKDIQALQATAKQLNSPVEIVEKIEQVNQRQKKVLGNKVLKYFKDNLPSSENPITVAVWGLSFKPNTDDMRGSPAITFIQQLLKKGFFLRLFDPVAMEKAKLIFPDNPNIYWAKDEMDAVEKADATALLTEWKQFRVIDLHEILQRMKGFAFFDARNQYKPHVMFKQGFDYISIGRPPLTRKQEEANVYA